MLFNTDEFIKEKITRRQKSLFKKDITTHHAEISIAIKDKSVLVIGGAGTIGAAFIKSLLPYQPKKLIVVDINENGLTELVRDCRSSNKTILPDYFKFYPLNFGSNIFDKIFQAEAPFDIVANFAAHKHVRSEKDVFSIEAMIENNVINAKYLLDTLNAHKPEHFFCVSTDKAANPVNIMGASKKLMEEVILAYSKDFNITTARFANVAFSNGSLLAGFIERIMKQQPLSCPEDVKRFFVSPQEAGEICLLACVLGKSGEIFFPKLQQNDMINFADIAIAFIQTLGYEPLICTTENEAKEKAILIKENKYPVYFFASETSGEKLYEEFYTEEEFLDMDTFTSLGIIKNAKRKDKAELSNIIFQIKNLFLSTTEKHDVIALLNKLLPGFRHIETGINLDQKM
ncbi:MAG: polysaccharide biosynthesis protein [Parafilimonas sp.]|nr:polysaccharide biosynthesis protein [Parafilimonas sp.]